MKWDYAHLQYFGTFAFIACCSLEVWRWEQIESSGPNTAPADLLCAGCCANTKALTALPASVNLPSTKETRECGTAESREVLIYKCSVNSALLWLCSKVQHLFIGDLLILNVKFKQKVWMMRSPETQWKIPGVFNRHFITLLCVCEMHVLKHQNTELFLCNLFPVWDSMLGTCLTIWSSEKTI